MINNWVIIVSIYYLKLSELGSFRNISLYIFKREIFIRVEVCYFFYFIVIILWYVSNLDIGNIIVEIILKI